MTLDGVVTAWTGYRNARTVATAAKLDQRILEAMQAFRSERGDTAATLSLSGEQAAAMRKVIDGHRGRVDGAIRALLAAPADLPVPGLGEALKDLEAGYGDQLSLRRAADEAYAREAETRDKALAARVLKTGDAVLARLERVATVLERQMARLDPETRLLTAPRTTPGRPGHRRLARRGRQHRPVEPDAAATLEQAEAVQTLRGRYEATWKLAEAATGDLPPAIAAAVATAQAAYFTPEVTAVIQRNLRAFSPGAEPAMTLPEWQKFITPKLNTIVAVANEALAAGVVAANAAAEAAERHLIVNAALFAAALLLVAASCAVAHVRIALPIRRMTAAMQALARGRCRRDGAGAGAARRDRRDGRHRAGVSRTT